MKDDDVFQESANMGGRTVADLRGDNSPQDPVGVGIHPADIEYDHKDKPVGKNDNAMNPDYIEARDEQRRAFAIEQAQPHSTGIEELLENAQQIVTFLESNGG